MAEGWDEVTGIEWENALARQQWQERLDANGKLVAYTLHVPCPRCSHQDAIDLEHRLSVIIDRDAAPSVIRASIYAQCECMDEHAGRPTGETGCGARVAAIEFSIPNGAG